MKKHFAVIVVLLLLAGPAIYLRAALGKRAQWSPSTIELDFKSMPKTQLESIRPDSDLLDSITITNVAGVDQVLVNFYQVAENNTVLVLQDRLGFYDLALSFEGEPDKVSALARDLNSDGGNELVITVDQGATIQEIKVYTYNGDNWVCLLASENLITIDLNNDAAEEMVSTSMGSLPGYVWIYRWNGSHFEKSDVTENTENIYATLVAVNGKNLIETGIANEPRYYEYADGSLVEVDDKLTGHAVRTLYQLDD